MPDVWQKILANSDKKIKITNLNSQVKIIFQITRGYEFFEIFDELEKQYLQQKK